jgi:uncharacterized protein YqgV (UPF0045/DUF77 family)
MQLSVEISKYPLTVVDYVAAIKDFIERLNRYDEITIVTNDMSTQLFGEYDQVSDALQREMKVSFEKYQTSVFVCKFIPGNLLHKHSTSNGEQA